MKISYVTTFNVHKPKNWARRHLGLFNAGARIIRALEKENLSVRSLGELSRKSHLVNKAKWLFYKKLYGQDFCSWADPTVSIDYARQIQKRLTQVNSDVLLCLENAIPLAMVKPDRPMVLWTDTTLGSLIDFYPHMSNLCAETKANVLQMERNVLERCSLLIVNSSWAAKRAMELYDMPMEKIKVIPRVSSSAHSLSKMDLKTAIAQREESTCHLLFVGVDWQRKGGNTALEVAKSLNAKGIKTELHIVGCFPPTSLPEFVKVHGFVDRTTTEGQAKMERLFRATHFLIYPTQADALGMVLSEAGAYGIPALATDVGGISDLVRAGVTGKTFALGSDSDDYCKFVAPYMNDANHYQTLAHSTLNYYCQYASESAVGKQAKLELSALLKK